MAFDLIASQLYKSLYNGLTNFMRPITLIHFSTGSTFSSQWAFRPILSQMNLISAFFTLSKSKTLFKACSFPIGSAGFSKMD
ncbi:hypothetical protein HUJ04_004387 [Dendroctonus ponderosae]|nr:hypothetical protein HUJ04_004387 [Dendroctonus ponderosae]